MAQVQHRFWNAGGAIFPNCVLEVRDGDVEEDEDCWVRDERGVAEVDGRWMLVLDGVIGEVSVLPER